MLLYLCWNFDARSQRRFLNHRDGLQGWRLSCLSASMPFVDLHNKDDFASIFYVTNSEFGNVGGFDPEKPTVIILHPMFLDTQWLDNHWGDPRIYKNCNLIAFDMRCAGRSVSRPNARHDTWVEAADIALCHLVRRICDIATPL